MEYPNDRSFLAVKESSWSHNIQTSQRMVIYALNVYIPHLGLVGSSYQHQLGLHWLPHQPSGWLID